MYNYPAAPGSAPMQIEAGVGPVMTQVRPNPGTAHLWLFSKITLPTQYRRAYQYKFGGDFNRALDDKLQKIGTVGGLRKDQCFMRDDVAAMSAILPEAQAAPIHTGVINELWTFVLVVDKVNNPLPWQADAPGSCPVRDIYTGFVQDEPVTFSSFNRSVHGGNWVPNMDAYFIVTHHTRLNSVANIGPSGPVMVNNILDNKDYVNGQIAQNLQMSGDTLFDLRPSKVVSSIVVEPVGDDFAVSGAGHAIANDGGASIPVDGSLNSPAQHINRLVTGFADATFYARGMRDEDSALTHSSELFLDQLANQLSDGQSFAPRGTLDPSRPFSMRQLDEMFPMLQVVVANRPNEWGFEVGDNAAPTAKNIFTSLISYSLPDMLINNFMTSVIFTYDSTMSEDPNTDLHLQRLGGRLEITHFQPLAVDTPDRIAENLRLFMIALKTDLFPIISYNVGPFRLIARASVDGESVINLQLYDFNDKPTNVIQSNRFGGLNTPIIGTVDQLTNNAAQLYGTQKTITQCANFPEFQYPY